MSIINFPAKNIPIKNNFTKDYYNADQERFHIEYMETLQKTDEYKNELEKILYLRELLISKYNADEQIVDEFMEKVTEITALEFNYIQYKISQSND